MANSETQANQTYVGQNLYNIYSVRSYKAEVTMLGDAMIQPMMYFQLNNIPMFYGAYLITRVKHNIQPNNMVTTFTGTRVKKYDTPIVDAATLFSEIIHGVNYSVNPNTKGARTTNINYTTGSIKRVIIDNEIEITHHTNNCPSPGYFKDNYPDFIVLHWTAGAGFDDHIKDNLCYHIQVDPQGVIHQTMDLNRIVYHAGCGEGAKQKVKPCTQMNGRAIGIAYDGSADGNVRTADIWKLTNYTETYQDDKGVHTAKFNPSAQWEGLINSILYAKKQQPSICCLTSHHWTSADKDDVGDLFPWEDLINEIEKRTTEKGTKWRPIIATHWIDDTELNKYSPIRDRNYFKFNIP